MKNDWSYFKYLAFLSVCILALSGCTTTSLLPEKVALNVEQSTAIGPYKLQVDQPNYRENRVVLEGRVGSLEDSERIELIALETAGVESVDNNLVVDSEAYGRKVVKTMVAVPDTTIASNIDSILDQTQLGSNVRSKVENGVVYLEGNASDFRVVDGLLARSLNVKGVKQVRSAVTINGQKYMKTWDKVLKTTQTS